MYMPISAYDPGPEYKHVRGYGTDPSSGGEWHSGQDFSAPAGTPIRAASPGTVVYSGSNSYGYGNVVVVKSIGSDDVPYYALYAHQNGVDMAQLGTKVHKGDVIGHVGSTGMSTGPHLHFELLIPDGPIVSKDGGKLLLRKPVGYLDEADRVNPDSFRAWADESDPTGDDARKVV